MKNERIFPEGRTLAEQYAYEAPLIAESSMQILREMEHLDPHLLGEYKSERVFPNGRTIEEQYAFEAEDGAADVREMLSIMEPLDPHLLDEYENPTVSKRQHLQARLLRDIALSGNDSADMATSLENLDPELID
jgi:hypothetical protein